MGLGDYVRSSHRQKHKRVHVCVAAAVGLHSFLHSKGHWKQQLLLQLHSNMKRSGFLLHCVFDLKLAGSLLSASHSNIVYRSLAEQSPVVRGTAVGGMLFWDKAISLHRVW